MRRAGGCPSDPDAIRELAVAQWTQTVAFRETIEAMHADGLRLFVDVGARGNLAGFVEDTLRGKPSFAVAANLPRRAGLTQLNHLVAATFAHGASLKTDYLYARRRPRAIDWNAPEPASRTRRRAEDRLSRNDSSRMSWSSDSARQHGGPAAGSEASTKPFPVMPAHEPMIKREHEHHNGNGFAHNDHMPAGRSSSFAMKAVSTRDVHG